MRSVGSGRSPQAAAGPCIGNQWPSSRARQHSLHDTDTDARRSRDLQDAMAPTPLAADHGLNGSGDRSSRPWLATVCPSVLTRKYSAALLALPALCLIPQISIYGSFASVSLIASAKSWAASSLCRCSSGVGLCSWRPISSRSCLVMWYTGRLSNFCSSGVRSSLFWFAILRLLDYLGSSSAFPLDTYNPQQGVP